MKQYNRIMLGRGGMYVEECVRDGYIGVDFNIYEDLSAALPENWREFNKRYIPVFMEANPDKSKVAAGLSCSMLWTICKGLQIDDVVISPDGNGQYYVGQYSGLIIILSICSPLHIVHNILQDNPAATLLLSGLASMKTGMYRLLNSLQFSGNAADKSSYILKSTPIYPSLTHSSTYIPPLPSIILLYCFIIFSIVVKRINDGNL